MIAQPYNNRIAVRYMQKALMLQKVPMLQNVPILLAAQQIVTGDTLGQFRILHLPLDSPGGRAWW